MFTRHFPLLALLVLSGMAGCDPVSPESKSGDATSGSADLSVLVLIDKTQSEDSAALQPLLPELKAALMACVPCRTVVVMPVGSDGRGVWQSPVQKFFLPRKPGSFDGVTVQAEAHKKCGGRRNCEDKFLADAKAQFDNEAAVTLAQYEQERTRIIQDILTAVQKRATKEPPCTDLADMAAFIAQAPYSHVVWLSDGAHSCPTRLKQQTFPNNVLLGLMPLAYEPHGSFVARQANLAKTYPNATIKPNTTISSKILLDFFQAQAPLP